MPKRIILHWCKCRHTFGFHFSLQTLFSFISLHYYFAFRPIVSHFSCYVNILSFLKMMLITKKCKLKDFIYSTLLQGLTNMEAATMKFKRFGSAAVKEIQTILRCKDVSLENKIIHSMVFPSPNEAGQWRKLTGKIQNVVLEKSPMNTTDCQKDNKLVLCLNSL